MSRHSNRVTVPAMIIALLLAASAFGSGEAATSDVYEDQYVRLTAPPGWGIQSRYEQNGGRGVLLANGNYKLYLRFHTDHASGIKGGRLTEAFTLRWLQTDDAPDCSVRFHSEPRRVSPSMQFYRLTLDGSDCDTRVDCGIKLRIGMRWVGGYFSPDGAYFFGPSETRAFTLTYDTDMANGLPLKDDAVAERVIREAIAIVNSIQYKAADQT